MTAPDPEPAREEMKTGRGWPILANATHDWDCPCPRCAASAATADDSSASEFDELWSLLDWSLWGAGVGDELRERCASVMVAAISSSDRQTVLECMESWKERRGTNVGRALFEELKAAVVARDAELAKLRADATDALRSLGLLIEDHDDPGIDALCAAHNLRGTLGFAPAENTAGLTPDRLTEVLTTFEKEGGSEVSREENDYQAGWHDALYQLRDALGIGGAQ